MALRNWGFEKLFSKAFVYNILWEDTEVDEEFLGVNEQSRVLSISGAGCGVANQLSSRPQRVDAVDINPHHLALTALKVAAAQRMASHDEFYSLFGWGTHPDAKQRLPTVLDGLPSWIRDYWKSHHRMFRKSAVQAGLTAQMLRSFRHMSGLDASWLRARIGETVSDRHAALESSLRPVFKKPLVRAFLKSPLHLISIGVNYSQRDRILETEGTDLVDYLLLFLKRIAETDLERNWYAWYAVAGHYNHDCEDAVQPYLRRDHHERSYGAPTDVRFHKSNIFDVLSSASSNSWTHYTLCDATDWMNEKKQAHLFDEILRTSQDGARVLYRSVEDDSLIARHGLERHFQLDEEASRLATERDRTRQYRRVNFYTVCH